MDKALYKWFIAVSSEEEPVTGSVIIEKAKFVMMKLI
jgi:hypothetical protein